MPLRHRPSRLKRLALALAVLLLSLLAVECVLRLAGAGRAPGYPPGLFVADPLVGFRLASDFSGVMDFGGEPIEIRTNAEGFRDEPLRPRRPGEWRVLCLGDSFAFGHGVAMDDGFPEQIEMLLESRGQLAQVINTAAPGYSTVHEYALLQQLLEPLDPDVVLLCLYVGNDFKTNNVAAFGRLIGSSGVLLTIPAGGARWWRQLGAAAMVHSRTLTLLQRGLASWWQDAEDLRRLRCESADWGDEFGIAMLREPWDDVAEQSWTATVELLGQAQGLCRERGTRLVLVLLPGPYQYFPPAWTKALKTCGLEPTDFVIDKPNRRLVSWAGQRGLEVVDLLPVFRERMRARPDTAPFLDVHFSALGHRWAAEALVEVLAD